MLVVDHESIGDRHFLGQRHAAYACCTGEVHAEVWGFSFLTTGWQVKLRVKDGHKLKMFIFMTVSVHHFYTPGTKYIGGI